MRAEKIDDREVSLTPKAGKSLEDWQVRLSGAVLLNALSSADPGLSPCRYFGDKRLHKHRLPDAWLTCDESDPARTPLHSGEPVIQLRPLRLTTNQELGRGNARETEGEQSLSVSFSRRCRRRFCRKRGNVGVSDRRDEAIPATVDCLDEAWNPCLIAKRYAEFPHRGRQNRITDRRCWPRRRQQFILCDKVPRLAQQTLKYCKRLMTQADVLFTLPQPLVK